MDRSDIKELNLWLASNFGKELDGKPKFRIIWSNDETEYRRGTFEKYYGQIYLGIEENVVKLCPKYSYLKDRYVLEKLIFCDNPELLHKQSYEPIFVFQDKDGNYLHPVRRALQLFMSVFINPIKRIEETEEEQKKKEFDQNLEMIQNASPWLAGKLHDREAVTVLEKPNDSDDNKSSPVQD